MKTRQNCAMQAKLTARSPVSSASWRDDAGSGLDAASWCNSRPYLSIEPTQMAAPNPTREGTEIKQDVQGTALDLAYDLPLSNAPKVTNHGHDYLAGEFRINGIIV